MMESLAILANGDPTVVNPGDTAWMLVSSALVLLMVPGLALFYGGMVRRKNVLTTMLHSFVAMGLIGVHWVVVGYALAFGTDYGGLIGWNWDYFVLSGIGPDKLLAGKDIPELVFVMFQGKFAIITPALISGAVAERMKFSSYVMFILLWSTFIYCPLAHWVWGEGGWLLDMGVLDFAGGTVVHVSAGVSALALIMLLGRRRDYPTGAILPNNLVLTLTGAGLLWFGWFGFNAGSAVAGDLPIAGEIAGLAFTNTQTAAAAAALIWMLIEWWHSGKPTALGMASGIVAGLVAITPAAGHVTPAWALIIGAAASLFCYTAVQLKGRFKVDDSLDAFGVHGVGGAWGAIATGIFVVPALGGAGLITGEFGQFGKQVLGVVVGAGFAFFGTLVIAYLIKATMGLRVSEHEESEGLDLTVHGEQGYHLES
jgi:Amt family ammonium transporter